MKPVISSALKAWTAIWRYFRRRRQEKAVRRKLKLGARPYARWRWHYRRVQRIHSRQGGHFHEAQATYYRDTGVHVSSARAWRGEAQRLAP